MWTKLKIKATYNIIHRIAGLIGVLSYALSVSGCVNRDTRIILSGVAHMSPCCAEWVWRHGNSISLMGISRILLGICHRCLTAFQIRLYILNCFFMVLGMCWPQWLTGYLGLALVFVWGGTRQGGVGFCFSGGFCWCWVKLSFWGGFWAMGYHSVGFGQFPGIS